MDAKPLDPLPHTLSGGGEPLPCPFCGGPAKSLPYNGTTQATCAGDFECAGTDVLAPVGAWNRRASPDIPPAAGAGVAWREAVARLINRLNPRNGYVTVSVPALELALSDLFAALSAAPPPADSGWRSMETAPRDGTRVLLWTVHANAKFSDDPVGEGWAAPTIGEWIDHNGGGWTWNGLCGVHTHWAPLPPPPADHDASEGRGGSSAGSESAARGLRYPALPPITEQSGKEE